MESTLKGDRLETHPQHAFRLAQTMELAPQLPTSWPSGGIRFWTPRT